MVPLCGDYQLAGVSEPYKTAGNFMCIDPWIVNVSNCVRESINRIKIATIYLMHISSAIDPDTSIEFIRYMYKSKYRVYKTYARHMGGIHKKSITR